jgi:hypothetical protein
LPGLTATQIAQLDETAITNLGATTLAGFTDAQVQGMTTTQASAYVAAII